MGTHQPSGKSKGSPSRGAQRGLCNATFTPAGQRRVSNFATDRCQNQGTENAMVTLADIETARETIAGKVLRTPLLPAPPLSALTGAEVFVKYENLQVTNSFKERGACVKLG